MSRYVRIAVPVPLSRTFDYLNPTGEYLAAGIRVIIPFGRRTQVGIVLSEPETTEVPENKIRPIQKVLDSTPVLSSEQLRLLRWAAGYYQYPLGEVIQHALPALLRKGVPATLKPESRWHPTDAGSKIELKALKRAQKQQAALERLRQGAASSSELAADGITNNSLKALAEKGLAEQIEALPEFELGWPETFTTQEEPLQLNTEQAVAVAAVDPDRFGCYLIDGVTGSGKTEVYLQLIQRVLTRGQQALVMVPEIGLTPQTIHRFRARFNTPVVVLHSALSDRERLDAWLQAGCGAAGIIIGTRSSLFTALKNPGLIVIDEEHDSSYKQQDSFRYHARDLAVMRAHLLDIPILLGSATPALETLHNARTGKYHHLKLTQRAGPASLARQSLLDIKNHPLQSGLSPQLLELMKKHLDEGNQVMLFLNRRGYAPALMCHECGWLAACPRCDRYFTVHQHNRSLHCHHCDEQRPTPHQCIECGSTQLMSAGVGTEQIEELLTETFPDHPTIRIDRDSTRRKGSFEQYLDAIHKREYRILIGTQMLAKGHHFPDVTLVALVDIDSALFSSDFRAAEKIAQLYLQVAGRAGRASKPGQVVLQSHHPEHQLLQTLVRDGYPVFAEQALQERQMTQLPPYTFQALYRAESTDPQLPESFLSQLYQLLIPITPSEHRVEILGPMPAPMAKRAGKYRAQLLLQCTSRQAMNHLLHQAQSQIEQLPNQHKVRWSLDVDPTEMY